MLLQPFIENSIWHGILPSNRHGNIMINVTNKDNKLIINIIDDGIGFRLLDGNIKNILNPYFTTKKHGTGLGLAIVNKIINDHNGTINFIPIKDGAKIKITFVR